MNQLSALMIHMEYNAFKAYHLPADDSHEKNQALFPIKTQKDNCLLLRFDKDANLLIKVRKTAKNPFCV